MSYVRAKMINGHGPYYYEVRSEREGKNVRQVYIRYLGTSAPVRGADGEWVPTSEIGAGPEPVVPKKLESIEHGGVMLERQEDFSNGSRLYVEPGVDPEDVSQLRDSFERLPPRMQNDTPAIQVFGGQAEKQGFYVGGKHFDTWGHWDARSKAIRVWTGSKGDTSSIRRTNTPERADSLLAHEVTHATFDRYSKRYGDMEEEARPGSDEVEKDFKAKRETIDRKYAPKLKEKEDRLETASRNLGERRSAFLADSGQNTERADRLHGELESAKKARSRAQADYTRAHNQRDKERSAYTHAKTDEEYYNRKRKNLDAAIDKEGPSMRAWVDFFKASEKEGGLTPYSNSYLESGERSLGGRFHNENLAEATSIWYTVPHRVYMAKSVRTPDSESTVRILPGGVAQRATPHQVAEAYPETHAAYFRFMDTESEGHVVRLKNRPRGWTEKGAA